MKNLNIARFIPFYSNGFGGPFKHISMLSHHLSKYNVKNVVYTSSDMNKTGSIQKFGIEKITEYLTVKRYPTICRFKNYIITTNNIYRLTKESTNFDIFHSHGIRSYQDDLSTIVAYIKKKPLVITTHGAINVNFSVYDKMPKKIHDLSLGILKKLKLTYFIAVSKIEVQFIENWGIPKERIRYIPHGIDTNFFKPTDFSDLFEKYNLTEENPIILYVGRISKRKGIEILIKAFKKVSKEFPKARLLIAGNEYDFLMQMKTLIIKLNLKKLVQYIGFIPKEQLPKLYSLADVVVYPTFKEIFGHVILEANACGKPIIASNEWGPKQLIKHNETGFLCNYGDINCVAKFIRKCITNKELTKRIGLNGREYVKKNYSWEICAKKHYNLYKTILGI